MSHVMEETYTENQAGLHEQPNDRMTSVHKIQPYRLLHGVTKVRYLRLTKKVKCSLFYIPT